MSVVSPRAGPVGIVFKTSPVTLFSCILKKVSVVKLLTVLTKTSL